MKAKFTEEQIGRVIDNREREQVHAWTVAVVYKGEVITPVVARCYMGRSASASAVYASVWISDKKDHVRAGSGMAGGYGYHKESAAVGEALHRAGVRLYGSPYADTEEGETTKRLCSISGVGEEAIRTALVAVVRALGYSGPVKIIS